MFKVKKSTDEKTKNTRNNRIQEMKTLQFEFNEARKNWDKIKEDEIFMKIFKKFEPFIKSFLNIRYWNSDWIYLYKYWFIEDYLQEYKFQLLRRISDYWNIHDWKLRWPWLKKFEDWWNLMSIWILLIQSVYQNVLWKYKEVQKTDAYTKNWCDYFCDVNSRVKWVSDDLQIEDIIEDYKAEDNLKNLTFIDDLKKLIIDFYILWRKNWTLKVSYQRVNYIKRELSKTEEIDVLIKHIKMMRKWTKEKFKTYLKNNLL